jgi:hypothetical protein
METGGLKMLTRSGQKVGVLLVLAMIVLTASPLVVFAAPSYDENPNPNVIPPYDTPYGKSYGEWAAEWWIWAELAGGRPVLDETGEYCGDGQYKKGPWFLAGTAGEVDVVRECQVPTGRMLFFPIINIAWIKREGDPPEEDLRAMLDFFVSTMGDLEVIIDGRPLQQLEMYRAQSPTFTYPAGHWYPPPEAPGSIADGFYIMLAPLSAGEHTIEFGGGSDAFGFATYVTYNLTVKKEK